MSKVVKLSSVMEREEKLKEIYEGLEEIKDQLTALIDEYEEEESHTGKAEELIEALDALEDASETIFFTHRCFGGTSGAMTGGKLTEKCLSQTPVMRNDRTCGQQPTNVRKRASEACGWAETIVCRPDAVHAVWYYTQTYKGLWRNG